jgi:hypothetical protein
MMHSKLFHSFAILAVFIFSSIGEGQAANSEDGIAIAIVYDTSGSMADSVHSDAGMSPKYVVANRALDLVVKQIQKFAENTSRKVQVGLFVFDGQSGAKEAVKFGPFNPTAIQTWAKNFSSPGGGTPIGGALDTAARTILNSNLTKKHVLVITDGLNTIGPDPSAVVPKLQKDANGKNSVLFIHFVAFDIDAAVFAPIKKLGVTVVGASDEKQLNQQIDVILKEKILLEDEEISQGTKKN